MAQLTGQIGVIYGTQSLLKWLVQKITRSNAHHVVVAISETECIGAEPGGAVIRPITDFPNAVWSQFDLTEVERAEIVEWCHEHVGVRYSYLTDAAIAISFLFGIRLPHWLQAYLSSDLILECAQLADLAYRAADRNLFPNRFPGQIYPGSFIPVFDAHGWWPTHLPQKG
jgi:hypothetical protein